MGSKEPKEGRVVVSGRNEIKEGFLEQGGVEMDIDGQKVETSLPEGRSIRSKCTQGRAWEYGVYRKWLESWSSGRA